MITLVARQASPHAIAASMPLGLNRQDYVVAEVSPRHPDGTQAHGIRLTPRWVAEMVKIGVGRDAAGCQLMTTFSKTNLTSQGSRNQCVHRVTGQNIIVHSQRSHS
jgi:hypothetical protein